MTRFFGKCGNGGLMVAVVLLSALAACSPTEGDDGSFVPLTTTNTDYNSPVFVTVGNNPITMDAADYDSDLDLDIVVVNLLDGNNEFNGSLSLLINDGLVFPGIGFTETRIAIAPFATKVKFAELNVGLPLDIVVLVNDEDNPHVWFCIDPSTLGCFSTQTFTLSGLAAQMKLVDLTGGAADNDVLLTIPSANLLTAIVNNPVGTYTQVDTPVPGNPGKFVVGNFDGVGDLDVAIIRPSLDDATVLAGDNVQGGVFTEITNSPLSFTNNPVAITAMDLDGVGGNESFAVASETSDEVRVQANNGSGSFTAVTIDVDKNPGFLLAGDFDAGGRENDLIVGHGLAQYVNYLKGNTSNPPSYSRAQIKVSRDPFAAVAGDVTGSGESDVIVAEKEKRVVSILASSGSGAFSRTLIAFKTTTTFPILVPTSLNFSGSGKSDLLLLQPLSDRVVILTNTNP